MNRTEYMAKKAALIRSTRLELELSQADVAEALGVSPATVSNWETGNVLISTFHFDGFQQFVTLKARERKDAAARDQAARSYAANARQTA